MTRLLYTFSATIFLLAAFLGIWWVQSYNKDLATMRDMVEAEINRMISEDFVFGELRSIVADESYIKQGLTLDKITGISTPGGAFDITKITPGVRIGGFDGSPDNVSRVTVKVLGQNHNSTSHFYYNKRRISLTRLPETVRDSIQRKFGIDLKQIFPDRDPISYMISDDRNIHVDHIGPPHEMRSGSSYRIVNHRGSLLLGLLPEFLFGSTLLGATGFAFASAYRSLHEQQRQIKQKDALVANVAHELKTPIATVGVALEALNMFGADADPQRRREYLNIGQSELSRLDKMADRAIDSLQGGKDLAQRLVRRRTDIEAIVDDAWRGLALRHQLPEATLTLKTYGSSTAYVDPHYWHHLVYNLLDNACKYGGAPARIEVVIAQRYGATEFSVTDNGPGIPVSEREKVFERFHRIYSPDDGHTVKGHGLGLTFVKQVATAHGGSVRVEEAVGGGASFVVSLPADLSI